MRKDLIFIVGIVLVFVCLFLLGNKGVDPNILRGVAVIIYPVMAVLLTRHFHRSAPEIPWACHLAAATALFLGASTLIGGLGHSMAVASLASRAPEYGPLQVMWFTTGALLVYTGATNAVLYRAIKAGGRAAIAFAGGSTVLFVAYMLFLNPIRGSSSSPPVAIAAWSVHLLVLAAAGLSTLRREATA
jgi:hypothetical protein